jgi:hypothetical protein
LAKQNTKASGQKSGAALKNFFMVNGEEVQLKSDALAHLADVLMEDIVDTPQQELLAEESQDFGDWRELVARFDNILAEASALSDRRSTVMREGADLNLADALCEDISAQPYEELLREASDDRGDYRALVVKFDNIIHRGLGLESPPNLSNVLSPSLFSKTGFSKLLDWLISRPQNRAAGAAFATVLLVAALTPVIYQLSRQTSEREHSLAPSLDLPRPASLEPVHPAGSNGGNARASAKSSDEILQQRSTHVPEDGEKSHLDAEQPRASVVIPPPSPDLVGPILKQRTAEAGAAASDRAKIMVPGRLGGGAGSLMAWAGALRDGDLEAAQRSLENAARNGDVMAAWKLGHMYADGDGVKQSDLRAFEYFRAICDGHADEVPGTAEARFVASAFVALGGYYLTGIPNSGVEPDAMRAREMFEYAASYFGDPDAQYHLGRMYLDGQGTSKDSKQAARWLFTAASKGQYQAQAVFGAMLFKGQSVTRDGARGLMWLMLARDAATPKETWITDLYAAALKQATEEERGVALVYSERWLKSRRE